MLDICSVEDETPGTADRVSEKYLDAAKKQSPVVRHILGRYGGTSLFDFLKQLTPVSKKPLQPREDLQQAVYEYVEPLLGADVARKASHDIDGSPIVLTANHHGVDYFSQSVQGSLLFSLYKKYITNNGATVPVFACGNVPLDNLTYPLGLLLYHIRVEALDTMPKKLPVFSNRYRRTVVSVSAPFDAEMVQRAAKRFDKMIEEGELAETLYPALRDILEKDYRLPKVLNQPDYSDQSVVLSDLVWKRMFADRSAAPDLIYLEFEKIVQRLLKIDLNNTESLAWQVLFNTALRENVLSGLNGGKACWELDKLETRLAVDRFNAAVQKKLNGCGTHFFWGINTSGRRVPLYLKEAGICEPALCGVDDRGEVFELPFRSEDILEALDTHRLLPSLFTSFLVLSFARGITCAGGYYQGEYLPEMQQALVAALRNTSGFEHAADRVKDVSTYTYLSGMQAVMTQTEDGCLIPAGPVEIVAGGGLEAADIEKILQLTVKEAHIASLFETVPDIVPWAAGESGWKKELALEIGLALAGRLVIK